MEMVYVPEGNFIMGDDEGYDWEKPEHEVYLNGYWIDKYEVTNAQYAACVAEGSCTLPAMQRSFTRMEYYEVEEYANFPVLHVDWFQAEAYCQWTGGSLPTEAQWEKAACGTDGRTYPWGEESPSCDLANLTIGAECIGDTTAVGSYPTGASPFGAMDLSGNVWEWVSDWYSEDYYVNSPAANPTGPIEGTYRGIRGTSWGYGGYVNPIANRRYNKPSVTTYDVGFRCVYSAVEEPAPEPTPIPTPEPQSDLGIGSTMVREVDGMEMVYVSEGSFIMGSDNGDEDAKPEHEVFLDAYWMDKYEVSNAQYVQFLNSVGGNQKTDGYWWVDASASDVQIRESNGNWQVDSGVEDHPMTVVNWYGAMAYCEWAEGSLPTEAQWEKAARGTDGRTYPWGEASPSCNLANFSGCVGDTSAVGSYPSGASPYGALDLAGNVLEWVADWYDSGYYASNPAENPTGPISGDYRGMRGGSWNSTVDYLHTADRTWQSPVNRWGGFGFRCAMPVENP
jgi:formylglycine-generating enzyme required for sulfatase activity